MNKIAQQSVIQAGQTIDYVITVNVAGANPVNLVVTDTLPANVTFAGFQLSPPGTTESFDGISQLSWTLPSPLPQGLYQLAYHVKVADFLQAGTQITNGAQMTYAGLGTPVTSSVTVKTILVEQFSQPIDNVELKNTNVIRSLRGVDHQIDLYYGGQYLVGTWDGTVENGNPAPNGEYHIKVDNIDSFGVVKSVTRQAMVSRALYRETILVYNDVGEVVRHLYTLVDDPGSSMVTGASLSTSVIAPSYQFNGGTPGQVSVNLSNGTVVVWDGKGDSGSIVSQGQYYVEVHSNDGQGGDTIITQKVAVMGDQAHKGVGVVTARPNVLGKTTTTTNFVSDATMTETLHVKIYTIAGELVEEVTGATGANSVGWDCAKLASGMYLAMVDLTDVNGGHVG